MPNGGLPVQPIRITLTREDGFTDIVFTDSKGKYELRPPRNQNQSSQQNQSSSSTGPQSLAPQQVTTFYRLTIESDRQTYETMSMSFSVTSGSPNQIIVFLRTLGSEKVPKDVLDAKNFDGSVPAKARASYDRAMRSINDKQLERAIIDLRQAIDLYPQYVRAINDLGVIFMKLNRIEEAAQTFRQAIDINPRFFHPRMNLGLVLNRQRKYKEAVAVLKPLQDENHAMLQLRLEYAQAITGSGDLATARSVSRSAGPAISFTSNSRSNLPRLGDYIQPSG